MEPTLAELSKQLSQGGWQEDEIQEHLLLAASDADAFNLKSNRELKHPPDVNYGVLPEIAGICNGSSAEHSKNAMALRSAQVEHTKNAIARIDGFRDKKGGSKEQETKTNPKEQKGKNRRRPTSSRP
mmetsp:Transcript_16858/g.29397  ORF Transcript_16858/g.29397 Transcript_16858/m.29397 type:complete len:127 (-) Transcript_16858:91-471(-)